MSSTAKPGEMMRYLCLGYMDEKQWQAIVAGKRNAWMEEGVACDLAPMSRGRVVIREVLQSPRDAVTLRLQGGIINVSDGPIAETSEQLGGIMVLESRDLNQAIQFMSHLPWMRSGGCLEIRPILCESNDREET